MFLLAFDVSGNRGNVRLADAERRVTSLPRKRRLLWKRLMNPVRRASLDFSDNFSNRNHGRQFGEEVDVILGSVDEIQFAVELSNDAAEVGEEPRFKRGIDERSAVFRREDDMREDVAVTMWHGGFAMRKSRRGSYLGNLSFAR